MSISFVNHQRRYSLGDRPRLLGCIRALAALAARRTPGLPWRDVTVHFVDDRGSEAFHRAVMNLSGATDVITQRYDTCPGEPPGLVGELFVNVERARTIRLHRGWTSDRELTLYIAHGFDHLTGADDHEPADYARMRRRELAWLRLLRW